ncbi:MAG: ParB/RepB/Spo0J family partition protein, partial [Planctomycetaceae bacterium]|nr:ParB/RepB/Spo0J family partition protein [Planctomycetaceae bacterium]
MTDRTQDIALSQIDPPIALLRMVDKGSVEYLELHDSVADVGYLCSISVRPTPGTPGRYQIIDGVHRYSVGVDLGFETIPAIIKENVTDEDVLLMQLQGNAVGKETEPIEYASRLRRILHSNPSMTLAELGGKINKSAAWVKNRLSLLRLKAQYHKYVDRGEMPLGSALMLSKLPPRFQPDFVERALLLPAKDFKRIAAQAITEYRESVQQGKLESLTEKDWQPKPYLRPLNRVCRERDERLNGSLVIMKEGCQTPLDGFYAAIDWVLNMDSASVELAREK